MKLKAWLGAQLILRLFSIRSAAVTENMIPGYKTEIDGETVEIPVDPVLIKAVHILIHRANRAVEWALKRGEIRRRISVLIAVDLSLFLEARGTDRNRITERIPRILGRDRKLIGCAPNATTIGRRKSRRPRVLCYSISVSSPQNIVGGTGDKFTLGAALARKGNNDGR